MNISHTAFSGDFLSLKKNLRQHHEAWRRALPPEQVSARGQRLLERLLAAPFWNAAHCVALYAAQAFEVPMEPLFLALLQTPKQLCFPTAPDAPNAPLALVRAQADLAPGPYGIGCPKAHCSPVALENVDLILVPGVAFAQNGARLGRGGGFYDRLLAHPHMHALRVGLCFEECLLPNLPEEPHDKRMHWVFTDKQCLECG